MYPKWLALGGLDALPHVDLKLTAHQRQFVREPDVNRAKRVLQ